MAEDLGDKTEAPTPRRREEAREQGQVARSPDLAAAVLLLGAMFLLKWTGTDLAAALRVLVEETLSPGAFADADAGQALHGLLRAVLLAGRGLAPLLVGLVVLSIVVNVAQVGFVFNAARLQPNLAALNPFKGLGSLFGGGQGPAKALLGLAKMLVLALVAWSAVADRIGPIVAAQQLDYLQIFGLGADVVYAVGLRVGVALLVLAVLDYAWQRWQLERKLRMTKQEVKEEMRRMEGDPKIKQRRRQIAQQMAMNRMKKDVPTADVVVTNPTHLAVALKYDAATMHAPRVVAKGQGYVAQRIREIAVAAGVPILERKPLARALYKLVEVGQEVPEEFYNTVAEILAYVYELSGKLRAKQSA